MSFCFSFTLAMPSAHKRHVCLICFTGVIIPHIAKFTLFSVFYVLSLLQFYTLTLNTESFNLFQLTHPNKDLVSDICGVFHWHRKSGGSGKSCTELHFTMPRIDQGLYSASPSLDKFQVRW